MKTRYQCSTRAQGMTTWRDSLQCAVAEVASLAGTDPALACSVQRSPDEWHVYPDQLAVDERRPMIGTVKAVDS